MNKPTPEDLKLATYLVRLTAIKIRELWKLAYRRWQASNGRPPSYRHSVRWDGGIDPHSKKQHSCIWLKIAMYLLERRLVELEPFVNAQLYDSHIGIRPTPSLMLGQQGFARFIKSNRLIKESIQVGLERQRMTARMAISNAINLYPDDIKSAYSYVILDSSIELTPLFRYCLSIEMGLENCAKFWQKAALVQYFLNPSIYNLHLKDYIPKDLKYKSDTIHINIQIIDKKGLENELKRQFEKERAAEAFT